MQYSNPVDTGYTVNSWLERRIRPPRDGWRSVALAAIACCTLGAARAADAPMRFEHLTLDDGLSQSNVMAILQDSSGRMWFGTENGLNRYDGYSVDVFNRERGNPQALGSDFIYDLAEDADGNLWIATNGGGLAMRARGGHSFKSWRHDPDNPDAISSNIVRRLLVNDDGTLWLGTRGAGLDLFDPATGRFVHHHFVAGEDHARSPNDIYALYRDAAGTLWIGSNRGVTRLDRHTGEVLNYRHDPALPGSLSDDRVRAIVEDSDGSLWVGTYGGGLNRLEADGSFTRFRHDPADATSLAGDRVTALFEDDAGRLWVGTSAGLNLVDSDAGSFLRYANDATDASSLGDDGVTTLYQDRGGILWVGTRSRGLSKWNPDTWAAGHDDGRRLAATAESRPNVTSFAVDADGRLWIGTFGDGLSVIDRDAGSVRHFRHDPASAAGLTDDKVMSLLISSAGDLWIGTMTGGVNRLEPATGEIRAYRHAAGDPASLGADGIMTIFEDAAGRIWIGTFGGGISRYDAGNDAFVRYLADPDASGTLTSNRVTSFAQDPGGKLWVGTDAGGLNLFDPATGEFLAFRHDPDDPQSLAADTVYAINVDVDGTVWVGTRGGGLDRVVGSADEPRKIFFDNVSQAQGLANNVVYGVQFDDAGQVWMSTNYGISRFDPETRSVRNLHAKDGLQSEEFNFGAHYRSAGGELFFGGHNGYNAFDPAAFETAGSPPPLVLTGVYNGNGPLRGGKPLDSDAGIEIGHRDDSISFEFAALDFAAPAENRYRYKLEGFDGDWIDLGNRRRVTYTDLDAGNYLLRVQAAGADSAWNTAGLSVPLRVNPAPWHTWWAYLSYVAMVAQLALFLWLGHRRKIAREEEYSHRLELEVRSRTEQLLERNKQLNQLNQTLQQSSLSDPLTGLRNRRFVFEEISRDLEVARRKQGQDMSGVDSRDNADLVFMMIDLDNFKPINDTFGHAAGDEMLLQVRDVLLAACRRSDYVVRWGGDEFVVIARQALPGESEALAERIRTRIADHNFQLEDGQIVRTTCSIGFAQFPLFRASEDESSLDQILGIADGLMYEAKKRRNAWAGLLGPTDAATSFAIDDETLEPTSLLFRARRTGRLAGDQDGRNATTPHLAAVR